MDGEGARKGGGRAPWSTVIERIRQACADQRYLLASLDREEFWQEFLVGWMACADDLKREGVGTLIKVEGRSQDNQLAQCWNVVAEMVDSALMVVDDRSAIPSADVMRLFNKLRGARIIFPDGSLHPLAQQRMSREQELSDITIVAKAQAQTRNMLVAARDINAMQAKSVSATAPKARRAKP